VVSRQEAWLRAWCAVAGAFNSRPSDCDRYADACVKAFDERFPPTVHEPLWCGKPISELTPEERSEMHWRGFV
jgi:hypothetical protein